MSSRNEIEVGRSRGLQRDFLLPIFVLLLASLLPELAVASPAALEVQTQLSRHSYDPGPIDGQPGPKTERALQSFLDKIGESFDGRVSANEAATLSKVFEPLAYLRADHESIELTGHGGVALEAYVFRPLGNLKPSPAVILLHGDSGDANLIFPSARLLAARGYVAVAVSMRGAGLSEGSNDCGQLQHLDLIEIVDQISLRPDIDPKRIAVWGYSAGAHAALIAAGKTDKLAAIVAFSGVSHVGRLIETTELVRSFAVQECGPDREELSPLLKADKISTPIMLVHGRQDRRVPYEQSVMLHDALVGRGKSAELFPVDGAGHLLADAEYAKVWPNAVDFLDRTLRSGDQPPGRAAPLTIQHSPLADRFTAAGDGYPAIAANVESWRSELEVYVSPTSRDSIEVVAEVLLASRTNTGGISSDTKIKVIFVPENDIDINIIANLFCGDEASSYQVVVDYFASVLNEDFSSGHFDEEAFGARMVRLSEVVSRAGRSESASECQTDGAASRGIRAAWLNASLALPDWRTPLFVRDNEVLVARNWTDLTAALTAETPIVLSGDYAGDDVVRASVGGKSAGGGTGKAAVMTIEPLLNVRIGVGQTLVVHGARGRRCGMPPPSWADVARNLPRPKTGSFKDGGIGVRGSRSCGGTTPARAVVFEAEKPGSEQIELFGDQMRILVE